MVKKIPSGFFAYVLLQTDGTAGLKMLWVLRMDPFDLEVWAGQQTMTKYVTILLWMQKRVHVIKESQCSTFYI